MSIDLLNLYAALKNNPAMVHSANPWLHSQVNDHADFLAPSISDTVWKMAAINIQSRAEPDELRMTASSPGLKDGVCHVASDGELRYIR